jgi:hypothetical protein
MALEQQEGQPFSKRVLPLAPGGSHEFDAVSADGMIVASIKSAGGRTSGGKFPGGQGERGDRRPVLPNSAGRAPT